MDECDGQAEPYPSGSAHQSQLLFKKIPSITCFPENLPDQPVMPGPNVAGFLALIFISHGLEYRQAGGGGQEVCQDCPVAGEGVELQDCQPDHVPTTISGFLGCEKWEVRWIGSP